MSRLVKPKFLLIIIIILIVTNIASLFITCKHCHVPAANADEKIETKFKKELHFTDEQIKTFRALRQEHFKNIDSLMKMVVEQKIKFFEFASNNIQLDSAKLKLSDSIATLQKELDKNNYNYFLSVRKICNPEQTSLYDSMHNKFIDRFVQSGFRKYIPCNNSKK